MADRRSRTRKSTRLEHGGTGRDAIAVVDSDHLQRVCTISTFSKADIDSVGLTSRGELLGLLERGGMPGAIMVALHPDTDWSADELLAVKHANGRRPLLLVAHESELPAVRDVLSPLLGAAAADLLTSPISVDEFTLRLSALRAQADRAGVAPAGDRGLRERGPSAPSARRHEAATAPGRR